MKVTPSKLADVLVVEPDLFRDERGYFMETWHAAKYAEHGIKEKFVQDNYSHSNRGVLRGLHYQLKKPQGKLVRVVSGVVYDVAVDVRVGSPTFSQWVGLELSGDNHKQLYIPPGFAHGFCVLSEYADFVYKCTDFYAPDDEYGIIWNDPDLGVDWPGADFSISDKDLSNYSLSRMMEQGLLPEF